MFERFTHAARAAVVRAQAEARELQHPAIGAEHLLLALLADDSGPVARLLRDPAVTATPVTAATFRADLVRRVGVGPEPVPNNDVDDAEALKAIGIDLDAVRRAIEENFGPGALFLPPNTRPKRRGLLRRPVRSGRFSDQAKKSLELALREALSLKHRFIAPEHLLLGVLRDDRNLGARILADADVDLTALRTGATDALRDRAA
jgi:ATP-dependent Clp protease ATP-binding subunit ClpA